MFSNCLHIWSVKIFEKYFFHKCISQWLSPPYNPTHLIFNPHPPPPPPRLGLAWNLLVWIVNLDIMNTVSDRVTLLTKWHNESWYHQYCKWQNGIASTIHWDSTLRLSILQKTKEMLTSSMVPWYKAQISSSLGNHNNKCSFLLCHPLACHL